MHICDGKQSHKESILKCSFTSWFGSLNINSKTALAKMMNIGRRKNTERWGRGRILSLLTALNLCIKSFRPFLLAAATDSQIQARIHPPQSLPSSLQGKRRYLPALIEGQFMEMFILLLPLEQFVDALHTFCVVVLILNILILQVVLYSTSASFFHVCLSLFMMYSVWHSP